MKNVLGKYKKLTESKSLKCYKEKLNIKDDITLYEHLIQLLRNIINYVSDDIIKENAYFGIYKLLNYIDEAVENINDKEQINTIRIYYLMEETISKIKQIDKSKRCSNEKIVIYKEIANRLENLSWEEYYDLAKKYYKHHGNLEILYYFKTNNGYEYDEDGKINLGYWISNHRQKTSQNSKEGRLLTKIGMVWNIKQNK